MHEPAGPGANLEPQGRPDPPRLLHVLIDAQEKQQQLALLWSRETILSWPSLLVMSI